MRGRTLFALGFAAFAAACSSDPAGGDLTDGGNIPSVDGSSSGNPVNPDGGGGTDSGTPDTTAPLGINDLAATTLSLTSIGLAWTAPADPPGGTVASYEIRRSTTNITSASDFAVATAASAPTPKPPSGAESITVTGLTPETTYYFAVRAKDAAGNTGPISNIASAATKARATLLVSEVAMLNATGKDFIELVATKAGNVKDIVVRQSQSPNILHTFADLDVAQGDRIVVHLTNLPGPADFQQEDAMKSKTASTETTTGHATVDAFDVYSTGANLVGSDNVVSVVDGTTTVDAVAYSDRSGDAAITAMAGFAATKTATQWAFTADPVDATNDCATQREAVGISTGIGGGNGACGRFQSNITDGFSINRNGTTDTNAKKDWYVAAQTPGAANSAVPAPNILNAIAISVTSVDIRFDQEIDAATVVFSNFTGSGITISAAALNEPSIVTLTTSTQNGPHGIGIAAALKTIYAASVPSTTRFCGYAPLGGLLLFNEVNPLIPANASGSDLVELKATRAGAVGGFSVRTNPTALSPNGSNEANFPAGLCVAIDDLVVVHLPPAAVIVAGTSETLAKDEHLKATYSAHYDTAWDVRGLLSSALPQTDAVLVLRDANDAYVDALVYTNSAGGTTTAFQDSLEYVQGLGLWLPANCGGAKCTDATTPTAEGIAVSTATPTAVGGTAAGNSLQRSAATTINTSWAVAAPSWGN